MAWWNKSSNRLLDLLEKAQADSHEMQLKHLEAMQVMVESTVKQAEVIKDYLKIFTDAPKPEVRSMTDVDELKLEQARHRAQEDEAFVARFTQDQTFDPQQWLNQTVSELRAES